MLRVIAHFHLSVLFASVLIGISTSPTANTGFFNFVTPKHFSNCSPPTGKALVRRAPGTHLPALPSLSLPRSWREASFGGLASAVEPRHNEALFFRGAPWQRLPFSCHVIRDLVSSSPVTTGDVLQDVMMTRVTFLSLLQSEVDLPSVSKRNTT